MSRRLASRLAYWAWAGATPAARAVRASLGAPAAVYGAAIAARNHAYDRGWLRVERVPARVLSVGNLTVGGTGKTPTSLWLAQALEARGCRVALVARGYRKTRPGVVFVGRTGVPLVSPAEGGDEAVMLASRFAGPVVTAERRVDAVRAVVRECAVDVIVLDDGFQHRALARDADLVLLRDDPTADRMLPAGTLREPLTALRRATAALSFGTATHETLPLPATLPVFHARLVPDTLLVTEQGVQRAVALERLAGEGILAVAGIARPRAFTDMLATLGARIVDCLDFPDHHHYDEADVRRIDAAGMPVVTTEKDMVKLAGRVGRPLWALRIRVAIDDEARLLGTLVRASRVDFDQN